MHGTFPLGSASPGPGRRAGPYSPVGMRWAPHDRVTQASDGSCACYPLVIKFSIMSMQQGAKHDGRRLPFVFRGVPC
jgi:hypothetical protein